MTSRRGTSCSLSLFPLSGEMYDSGESGMAAEPQGRWATSESDDCIKEHDQLLPIANVERIMKKILPANAKISKEAKQTMQESASEFLSFVTGEACVRCLREKRKTVNGDDICWALGNLGLDDYAVATRKYLREYRRSELERVAVSQGCFADGRDLELHLGGYEQGSSWERE